MTTSKEELATIHVLPALRSVGHRPCRCRFAKDAPAHHDRLLRIAEDVDQFVELMELAVTWGELDYSDRLVVPPNRWLEFVDSHIWADGPKAERMMSLATDVALGAVRSAGRLERTGI